MNENDVLTECFQDYSNILMAMGKDSFKIKAYINAIKSIQKLDVPISTIDYTKINGIGKRTSAKIKY